MTTTSQSALDIPETKPLHPSPPAIASREALRQHVLDAFERGRELSLDHCVYGPATGGTRGYINETQPYYHLLAGHLALTQARFVLEVGTHYGGSTLAMLEGLRAGNSGESCIVTMDLTTLNEERLTREPEIQRLIGDAEDLGTVRKARALLGTDHIDLLYIDALKDPAFVLRSMRNVYLAGMRPRFIVLDDVQTNERMREFWDLVEKESPNGSFLISRDFPHMRKPEMGYGIIHVPSSNNLLKRSAELMEKIGVEVGIIEVEQTKRFSILRNSISAVDSDFTTRFPDLARDDSSAEDLNLLHALARDNFHGNGDIVEAGAFAGATTRALCEGLELNSSVTSKSSLITVYDDFVHSKPALEKYVNGRTPLGGSLVPAFETAIGGHRPKVNLIDIQLNVARWVGRPIEILVLGMQRMPQTFAANIREFSPFLAPGRSIVINREFMKPFRPWACYGILSLGEHFEFLGSAGNLAVFGLTSPIAPWRITRLVQNDFSITERIGFIERFANDADLTPNLRLGLLDTAARLAQKAGMNDDVERLVEQAHFYGNGSAALEQRLSRMKKALGRADGQKAVS